MNLEPSTRKQTHIAYLSLSVILLVAIWEIPRRMQQKRFYRSAEKTLQTIDASEVTTILLHFHWEASLEDGVEIVERDEIEAFLAGMREIRRYYPSHDSTGVSVLVTILPINIQFTLRTIDRYPRRILGRFISLEPDAPGRIYGCFLSEGIYPWFQKHAKGRE